MPWPTFFPGKRIADEQYYGAREQLEYLFCKHDHDLVPLSPRFQAERFLQLLDEVGLTIVAKEDHHG